MTIEPQGVFAVARTWLAIAAGAAAVFTLPTGSQTRGLGSESAQVLLPVWIQKSYGKWTTYGGGGYWVARGSGNQNSWYAGWLLQ